MKSIPDREDIQIVVVDDNSNVDKSDFDRIIGMFVHADCQVLFTEERKGAGYARNLGLKIAAGKWLLFADADDFFENGAFDVFDDYRDSDKDVIFFDTVSRYSDTLIESSRNRLYNKIIERGRTSTDSFNWVKFGTRVPYGKLVRRGLVVKSGILFDEVCYANDIMFSTKVAMAANKVIVDGRIVYCVTERENSLVKQASPLAAITRFKVISSVNQYLRINGYKEYQHSLLPYFREGWLGGIRSFFTCLYLGVRYKSFNKYALFLTSRKMRKLLQS